jgi:threonine synthase
MTPVFDFPQSLRCRECERDYPIEPLSICEDCFGPLEPHYELARVGADRFKKEAENGPASLWRYQRLLPGGDDTPKVDLGAGFTPLRRAENLGRALGIRNLWIKDDSVNPSNSFKDRVVSVALTMSKAFGFEAVGCASTGNLANSTAAHAAKAGIPAYIFIPHDLERAKIIATSAYGAKVIKVMGNYDDVNRLCSEVADELNWAFVNVNMRPFYAEGSKSIGFEIAEQLGWQLPDHVVVPIASGALMTKIHRAFGELIEVGVVGDWNYRISGAQAQGCSPVAKAFKDNADSVTPVKPNTIAKSLAIGSPADGWYAIQTARQTNGAIEWCSEQEVLDGIHLLAKTEGVFTETAGGVTIAVLKRLREQGVIRRDEETVAVITGNGYKTIEALEEEDLTPTMTVEPDLEDFLAQLNA